MASNNFLTWGDNAGNIMSNADYESNIQRTDGVELGLADPALHNRLYRQVALMAAAIGQIIADSGLDANDGNMAELVDAIRKVFARWGGGEFSGKITVNSPSSQDNNRMGVGSASNSKMPAIDLEQLYGDSQWRFTFYLANGSGGATLYKGADAVNGFQIREADANFVKPVNLKSGGFGRSFASEDELKSYLKNLLGI